ncbi:hypothetical protein AGOR_G00209080 [Albula goreensis]|uniref:Uncharacterized protein n=1 Tax=Albula goreensis TaxID=1534307 RepID=A0A8T3CTI3_9TELE|nr:hypothetical protein AGOR_G00209080 [Albula goreensis]
MSLSGVTLFISLLAIHKLTAVDPIMMSSMMPNRNHSMMNFPVPPPGFETMAKKLMFMCLKMGHQIPMKMAWHLNSLNSSVGQDDMEFNPSYMLPKLLASLNNSMSSMSKYDQPNETSAEMESGMDWNMTERLQNCSQLQDMIALIKNSSVGPRCFMRALIAPISWKVLADNGSEIDPRYFRMLLWAAKPFLRSMLPPKLVLPPLLHPPHLAEMVKTLSELFDSLTPEQRIQIP